MFLILMPWLSRKLLILMVRYITVELVMEVVLGVLGMFS